MSSENLKLSTIESCREQVDLIDKQFVRLLCSRFDGTCCLNNIPTENKSELDLDFIKNLYHLIDPSLKITEVIDFKNIDLRILETLSKRFFYTAEIGKLKGNNGIQDPNVDSRWNQVVKNVCDLAPKKYCDVIREVYELIHRESKRKQALIIREITKD